MFSNVETLEKLDKTLEEPDKTLEELDKINLARETCLTKKLIMCPYIQKQPFRGVL